MTDAQADPIDPTLTIGQRVMLHRRRWGMSRDVLGGLVGKSGRWVKAVERGEIQQLKLPAVLSLAEALKIRDISQLTGGQAVPALMFRGPGHPALPAVRTAINSIGPVGSEHEPEPLGHLQARLTAAWRARHASPDHRTVLGALLPDLIRDARYASRCYEGAERRRAMALLAQIYNLAQFFVAYQPDSGLLWRLVERSIAAAEESEDPMAFGGAVWLATQAHRDNGDFDAAESVNRDGLQLLRSSTADDADPRVRAIAGALHHELAYTAARTGQYGVAWRWWEKADEIARGLPVAYYDPMTSFSRVVMSAHAVTIAVEARQIGEARRQANKAQDLSIPSQPRRGRHLIEVARAWQLAGDAAAALGTLRNAYTAAPETIRYNGYARRMTVEFARGPESLRPAANDLADQIGLLV
jgi:tetratricopeptide (TPR) repeat protein